MTRSRGTPSIADRPPYECAPTIVPVLRVDSQRTVVAKGSR
jgi:hypothetical protein